jgi:hypothetical protein
VSRGSQRQIPTTYTGDYLINRNANSAMRILVTTTAQQSTKCFQQEVEKPTTRLALSTMGDMPMPIAPLRQAIGSAGRPLRWSLQEWILKVGLQSLKTILRTGVHRSEQQVGLESRKTAIKLHRSAQQNKTKECNGAHYELCRSQE